VAQLLPPVVRFTKPAQSRLRVKDNLLTLRAVAETQNAYAVTGMQLLIDGRPLKQDRGQVPAAAEPGAVEMSWKVTLSPGLQRLRVLATTPVSKGLSEDLEVEYVPQRDGDPQPELYVLAFGIDDYTRFPKLRCAVNDATELSRSFQTHSRPLFRDVHPKVLTNAAANRKGMLEALAWLADQPLTRHDVVVIFFAGHGQKDSDGEFYLCPQDGESQRLAATAVSGTTLNERLTELPGRVLLILDACHAGRIGGLNDLRRKLTRYEAGIVVMCAADEQTAAGEKGRHGFFTTALIEGLSGQAGEDSASGQPQKSNRDGAVYITHLNTWVVDRVQELSDGEQVPVTDMPSSVRTFALTKPAVPGAPAKPAVGRAPAAPQVGGPPG
jgi:hypothetical protein